MVPLELCSCMFTCSLCQVLRSLPVTEVLLHSINSLIWASGFTPLPTNLVKITEAKADFS